MARYRVFCLLFLVSACCLCRETVAQDVTGYVSRVASPSDFDVSGSRIIFSPKTTIQVPPDLGSAPGQPGDKAKRVPLQDFKPYLGEPIDVYGKVNSKEGSVVVSRLVLRRQKAREISGTAVIDAVPSLPGNAAPGDLLVRADGYPVLITGKTATHFDKPLASVSEVQTNVWITFHGKQRPDGVVVADRASFAKNTISEGKDHLRQKSEYDPAAVAPDAKQSELSKTFTGIDPKQIPPYKDEAMEARVKSIGEKLVPAFQRDLPQTEETKIDFRFQVIDNAKWRDAVTFENGVILVPRQVVERMQNDSQVSAVLADHIARSLEKQPLDVHGDENKIAAAELIGTGLGFIIPGVGIATDVAMIAGPAEPRRQQLRQEQSGRVGLALMKDAGYDITQAPLAWWLLDSKTPKDVADIPLPERAEYLYRVLGEIYPPASTPPASSPSGQQ
jgi:hypothetical protein